MKCPAKWELECQNCPYCKEGLCDYPYIKNIIVESGNDRESKDESRV